MAKDIDDSDNDNDIDWANEGSVIAALEAERAKDPVRFDRLLGSIPAEYARAYSAMDIEGMATAEAAGHLRTTIGDVLSHASTARRKLLRLLRPPKATKTELIKLEKAKIKAEKEARRHRRQPGAGNQRR